MECFIFTYNIIFKRKIKVVMTAENKAKQIAGLKPIQKGEIRNKTDNRGRKKELLALFRQSVNKSDWIEVINKALEQAKEGDNKAREFLFDRYYGKVEVESSLLGNENRTLIQNNFNIDVSGKSASELIETLQSMQIESDEETEILE